MIVFCEDCSARNSITPDQFDKGRVIFKCNSCGYKNNYLLSTGPTDSTDSYKTLFSQLLTVPDILGAFFYHKKEGLLKKHMLEPVDDDTLTTIGKHLYLNLSESRSLIKKIELMVLYISGRNMVVKEIDQLSIMVVTCKTNEAVRRAEKLIMSEALSDQ